MNIYTYQTAQELFQVVTRHVVRDITLCSAQRTPYYLSVAGGSTPYPLYAHIATHCSKTDIVIMQVDERYAPHNQSETNQHMLQELFTSPRHTVYPVDLTVSYEQSIASYNAFVSEIPRIDCTILGMGEDGHIASLFTTSDCMSQGVVIGTQAPVPPYITASRITQTLPHILSSHMIQCVLIGQHKQHILDAFLSHSYKGEFPAKYLQQHKNISLHFAYENI